MKKVLITGSNGFIGKNLLFSLKYSKELEVSEFDADQDLEDLKNQIKSADFVFHLAGVNRPENSDEFQKQNSDLTRFLIDNLILNGLKIPVIFTSSVQAELNNYYGRSKLSAENHIRRYIDYGGKGFIFRLTNVFGKWCKPNYNSVIATFCNNIVNNNDIIISDRNTELNLVYIDDVIHTFNSIILGEYENNHSEINYIEPTYKVSLGEIADLLFTFKRIVHSEMIPDLNNDFIRKLHSTFLSYIPIKDASYIVSKQSDARGYLYELLKSKSLGQIFVSKTNPGITRGNHFHHSKNEKFCVINGSALIKQKHLLTNEIFDFKVDGNEPKVINILPGYTHSITNIGNDELITLFWANEPFDKERPDTFYEKI